MEFALSFKCWTDNLALCCHLDLGKEHPFELKKFLFLVVHCVNCLSLPPTGIHSFLILRSAQKPGPKDRSSAMGHPKNCKTTSITRNCV